MSSYNIFSTFLELLNIMPYPWRFATVTGFGMLLGYIIIGIPIFFVIYFILRSLSRDSLYRYHSKEHLTHFRLKTISLSLTLTFFLGFLASFIFQLLSLFVFEESLSSIDLEFQLRAIIPFSFFLILTPIFFIWYRLRKKHKIISTNDTRATKEEV